MAKIVTIEVEVEEGKAIKDLEKVKKGFQEVIDEQQKQKETTKETTAAAEELGGTLDNVTGGAVSKFKGLRSSLGNITKGLKSFKIALAATGIGLFVVAIGTLIQYFSSSEEGQNKLSKATKQFGVIIGNLGDVVSNFGELLYNVFTGNFDEASKAFDQFSDSIKNFGKETREEIKLAGDLADRIANANKRERELLVERAKVNVEINKLKTKAAEVDKFTAQERINFLLQAAALEDEITKKEVDLASTRRDIKIEENSLSKSKKEDLDEEARLTADVIALEEQRLIKNKELLGVAAGLRKTEADRIASEREAEINAFAKQREDIDNILEKSVKKNEGLELTKNQNVAESLRGLTATKSQAAEEDAKITELTEKQKLGIIGNSLGSITQLLGENSAAGKAAAIAQAVINSYLGFTEILKTPSTLPQPFASIEKIASAGSVLAAGLSTVKQITAVKTPTFGKSVSRGGSASAAPQAPAFNVVGASPENQLAQAIGEKDQQPVKAFVVSNEVTNAQALDRNIVESASIG